MSYKPPKAVAKAGIETGATKAKLSWDKALVAGFLAGDLLGGVGCNWLVCLAVWMALAAEDVAGKILAIFFPIMAFVAMGFDHVVANMFFLPAAIFAGVPDIGWGDVLLNWLLAGVGNLVGAVVFVSTSYWYLFLKDQPDKAVAADAPDAERA
jgi:formate transporter